MHTRCVDGHAVDVCLLIAQADIEKKNGKNQIMYPLKLDNTLLIHGCYGTARSGRKRVCTRLW